MNSSNMMESGRKNREFINSDINLPDSYGKTEIIAMVRDPNWFFTYWEITSQKANQIKRKYGQNIFEISKPVIRVYDIIGSKSIENATYFDDYVNLDAKNWYINAKESGKSYMCRLGLLAPDGNLIKIADSNIITLPLGRVSDITDEEWMVTNDQFDKLMEMSVSHMGASGEFVNLLAKRWEILKSISSGAMFVSSFQNVSSYSSSKQCPLELECKLVLSGGTCPQANITAGGKMVKVNADGTFTTNFNLSDSVTEIPVCCSTDGGKKQKKVIITAQKKVSK
ncbi:MAG TPA: DUF4912 domain-containing protein [Elusimicrobiales bacterium]|nr:DUF4912 domain-containing protein [Elusimicrobiales bacterium]